LPTSSDRRALHRTKRFGRDIRKIHKEIQEEAFAIAQNLTANIFDPSLNVRMLTGFHGIYRVVVIRDYRMIFSFDDQNLYLLRIGHRREIYRDLEL
jgi:mRNA-degrading endonuclease RelE of RelBE toxin-antitoxin system